MDGKACYDPPEPMNGRAMKPILIFAALSLAVLTLGSYGWDRLMARRTVAIAGDTLSPAAITRDGTVLTVRGPIGAATVKLIDRELDASPVRALRLYAPTGLEPAALALARRLNTAGTRVELGARALCANACIILLAELKPALRSIDNLAWLRVSGISAGPQDPHDGDSPDGGVAPWVKTLSGQWHEFLQYCPTKPLIRDAGLAMTWAEIQALARPPRPDCGKISFRNKNWVANNL